MLEPRRRARPVDAQLALVARMDEHGKDPATRRELAGRSATAVVDLEGIMAADEHGEREVHRHRTAPAGAAAPFGEAGRSEHDRPAPRPVLANEIADGHQRDPPAEAVPGSSASRARRGSASTTSA